MYRIETEKIPKEACDTGTLMDYIHGDGECLLYLHPTGDSLDYYKVRVDSSVRKMTETDDEFRDLTDKLYEMIEDKYGDPLKGGKA